MSSRASHCGNHHERVPTRKPQKFLSASSARLLASLFISASGSRMRREGSRSLSLSLVLFSVYVSRFLTGRMTHHHGPPALLTPRIAAAANLKYIHWVCRTPFLWSFVHTSYQLSQIFKKPTRLFGSALHELNLVFPGMPCISSRGRVNHTDGQTGGATGPRHSLCVWRVDNSLVGPVWAVPS